jgi:hypothetical protein
VVDGPGVGLLRGRFLGHSGDSLSPLAIDMVGARQNQNP